MNFPELSMRSDLFWWGEKNLPQILNQFSFPRDGGVGVAKFLKGSQLGDQQLCHARPYIVSSGDIKNWPFFNIHLSCLTQKIETGMKGSALFSCMKDKELWFGHKFSL